MDPALYPEYVPLCGAVAVYIPSISISLSAPVFFPCLFLSVTRMDEYTRKYTRFCLLILSRSIISEPAGRKAWKKSEWLMPGRPSQLAAVFPATKGFPAPRLPSPAASVCLFSASASDSGIVFRGLFSPPVPSTNRRDKSVDIILWLFLRCVFGWEGSGGRPCFCRFWILGMAQILVGIGSVSSQYGESSRRRCGNVAYGTCVGSLAHWQRGYPGTCNLYNVAYQTWSVWFINSRFLSMDFETFLNSLSSFLFVFVAEVDQWMKILHSLCFYLFRFLFFPLLFKLSIGYYVC